MFELSKGMSANAIGRTKTLKVFLLDGLNGLRGNPELVSWPCQKVISGILHAVESMRLDIGLIRGSSISFRGAVVVVLGAVVVVEAGPATRLQRRRLPTLTHLNFEPPTLRTWPVLPQVAPPIDAGWVAVCDAATGTSATTSGSGTAIGRTPVSAAAPT